MTVLREVIRFHGHPEVTATHVRTIEVTRDTELTVKGDCIVGLGADRGLVDLPEKFRRRLQAGAAVVFTMNVAGESFRFRAEGDRRLGLSNWKDMVIRKSDYVCGRTLAVRSEAAAVDLPRRMVRMLRRSGTEGELAMEVEA